MPQIDEEKEKNITSPKKEGADMSASQNAMDQKRSWGEKHANGVFNFTRSIAINYVTNFIIAAAMVFAFDTSKWGKDFRSLSARTSEWVHSKSGIPKQFTGFLLNLGLRTQLLLCGGHILLFPVTSMKDHQHHWEFRIRHALDVMQQAIGMGNTASKRSIAEYDRIEAMRKTNDPSALTEDDKKLLAKNHIKPDLTFEDHKQPTGNVLKARLTGMAFTTAVSFLLTLTKFEHVPNWLKFEEKLEVPAGKWFGQNVISRIPGISYLFKKSPVKEDATLAEKAALIAKGRHEEAAALKPLTGHQLIGICFIDDMIFTAASLLGFTLMERHHDKKIAQEEEAKAEADYKRTHEDNAEQPPTHFAARVAPKPRASSATERVIESRNTADYAIAPQM